MNVDLRPGERVSPFESRQPTGDWSYIVDDDGISYGPGPFPFHGIWMSDPQLEPKIVRLAPDCAYYAWGHEYVLLEPTADGRASADITITVRPLNRGAVTVGVSVLLDAAAGSYALGDCPAHVRDAAEEKAGKLLRFLQTAIAERDAGRSKPDTAFDRWAAQEAMATTDVEFTPARPVRR